MFVEVLDAEINLRVPNLFELLYENAAYARFLVHREGDLGRKAAYRFVESFLKEYDEVYRTSTLDYAKEIFKILVVVREERLSPSKFKKRLRTIKYEIPHDKVRVKLPLVKLGKATLEFTPYTYRIPGGSRKDPVNLVFWNQGRYGNVLDIMHNYLKPPWKFTKNFFLTCAETQYLYVNGEWVKMTASLSPHGCRLGRRLHARLFTTGEYDNNFGYVTFSAAHEEDFSFQNIFTSGTPHKIVGWDSARDFLENQFKIAGTFTKSVARMQIQPSGVLQGVMHDGYACFVEVL